VTLADACRATGELRRFLDLVEVEARAFGVTVNLTDDRERLAYLSGGAPACGAWRPREAGGVEGFWLDFADADGVSRGSGGGAVYNLGPLDFGELVNGGVSSHGSMMVRSTASSTAFMPTAPATVQAVANMNRRRFIGRAPG